MPKLTLTQEPTFDASALIPIPGKSPVPVQFTFKNRTRDQFNKFLKELEGKDKHLVLMEMAEGWELEESFTAENVKTFLSNYIGAFDPILDKYMAELSGAKEKN